MPKDIDSFVRKVLDVYNSHRADAFDELLTDDCVLWRNGIEARGRDECKRVIANLYRAIPDVQYSVDDVIAAGNKMAIRWTGRGTQSGEYLGIPPSGQKVSYDGITIYELADDRIARIWVSANILGLVRGLGVARPTPEARA